MRHPLYPRAHEIIQMIQSTGSLGSLAHTTLLAKYQVLSAAPACYHLFPKSKPQCVPDNQPYLVWNCNQENCYLSIQRSLHCVPPSEETLNQNRCNYREYCSCLFFFFFFLLGGCLFRAAPRAYGGSQGKGEIGSVAAGLYHRSWQCWVLNPLSEVRD